MTSDPISTLAFYLSVGISADTCGNASLQELKFMASCGFVGIWRVRGMDDNRIWLLAKKRYFELTNKDVGCTSA